MLMACFDSSTIRVLRSKKYLSVRYSKTEIVKELTVYQNNVSWIQLQTCTAKLTLFGHKNLHRNIRIRKCYAEMCIFYMITSSHPRVLLTIIYIEVLLDWCSVEAEIQFLCNVFYLRPTNHDILVYYEKINVKLR